MWTELIAHRRTIATTEIPLHLQDVCFPVQQVQIAETPSDISLESGQIALSVDEYGSKMQLLFFQGTQ